MRRRADGRQAIGVISQVGRGLFPPQMKARFNVLEGRFGDGPTTAGVELDDDVVDDDG